MGLWLSGTILTAMIDTIDQKIEWAQATPILETISIPKDAATGPTPISKEPPAPLFKRLGGACAAPYNQLIGT